MYRDNLAFTLFFLLFEIFKNYEYDVLLIFYFSNLKMSVLNFDCEKKELFNTQKLVSFHVLNWFKVVNNGFMVIDI